MNGINNSYNNYQNNVFDKFRQVGAFQSKPPLHNPQFLQEHSRKKKKGHPVIKATALTVTLAGLIAVTLRGRTSNFLKKMELISSNIKKLEEMTNTYDMSLGQKFYLKTKKILGKGFNLLLNTVTNLDHIKNSMTQVGIEFNAKTKLGSYILKPFKAYAKGITDLFVSFAEKAANRKYKDTGKSIEKAVTAISAVIENTPEGAEKQTLIKHKQKLSEVMAFISPAGFDLRVKDLKVNMSNFKKDYLDKLKSLLPSKDTTKKDVINSVGHVFSENLLAEHVFEKYQNEFVENHFSGEKFKKISEGISSVRDSLIELDGNSDKYSGIVKVLNKADDKFKKSLVFEQKELPEKFRDLFLGGAIPDTLTILVLPAILLVREINNAKTKREKVHTAIATGSVIGGSIVTWCYSSMIRCLSGGTAIAVSAVMGIVASKVGSGLADAVAGKNDKPRHRAVNPSAVYHS